MPELPEVETVANGVHARIAGARIDSVWCSGKPQTFKTPPERLEASLAGKVISRVRRVGKHIVVDLVKEPGQLLYAELLVHLGMTGRLLVSDGEVPMPKHTHLQLTLGDSRVLRFADLDGWSCANSRCLRITLARQNQRRRLRKRYRSSSRLPARELSH
jgi:formamidopyrimidine-DNA glycosylase